MKKQVRLEAEAYSDLNLTVFLLYSGNPTSLKYQRLEEN